MRGEIYVRFPELDGTLDALSYVDEFRKAEPIPDGCKIPFIPFQFHVMAAATAMTRDEFIAHQLTEAEQLRQSILQDAEASPALLVLAADARNWGDLYLAGIEQAGLLHPEEAVPPIREQPQLISVLATLASGILAGPGGQELQSSRDLVGWFDSLRQWYGHNPSNLAPIARTDSRFSCEEHYALPVPALPEYEQYDLGIGQPTHFETFRVYSPWLPFESRGAGLPESFQIGGPPPEESEEFLPLDLSVYLQDAETAGRLASLTGPMTVDTGGLVPQGQALPYTIGFESSAESTTLSSEIRIVTELDEQLDARSFRLGDLQIAQIHVHVPDGRRCSKETLTSPTHWDSCSASVQESISTRIPRLGCCKRSTP